MGELDVLFLTKYDRKGASSRYRSLQFFPTLEANGIECTYEPLFSDAYLETFYESGRRPWSRVLGAYLRRLRSLLEVREADVVVIEKELLPYTPTICERVLGRLDTPSVVDYDDAIFHTYDRSSNPLVRGVLGGKIDTVMRTADAVVAGNDYLARRARRAGASRIETIPTAIDLDRYPQVPPSANGSSTIGWIGSPTTATYVEGIAPALRTVCERRDAHVVLVGSGDVQLPGVPHEVREWSEDTAIDDIASFDVGIMPLEDTPWERGKCSFKLIQYMGCAKPVVASPVGMNREVVHDGHAGFRADGTEEWVRGLVTLCDDEALARRMGRRGRQLVADRYTLDEAATDWIELLRDVGVAES